MKANFTLYLGALCAALLFCGCQDAQNQNPVAGQEERQREETQPPQENEWGEAKGTAEESAQGTAEETSGMEYCTVDELKALTLSELGGENLYFSGEVGVDFSGIEAVNVLHLSLEDNFAKEGNRKKYAALFGVKAETLKKRSDKDSDSGTYESDSERNYMRIGKSGDLVHIGGKLYSGSSNTVEAKYDTDADDVSGVKITLADKKVELGEFCKQSEKWLGKNMPFGGIDGMKYHISQIVVRKPKGEKGGRRALSMQAQYEFQGMPLDSYNGQLAYTAKDTAANATAGAVYTEMDYEKSGAPSTFIRSEFLSVDSLERIDKVVDFKTAVRLVEERRAKFGSFRISKIVPMYALHIEEESKQGTKYEARPVYAFFSERTDYGDGALYGGGIDNYIYVDMVTGEVSMG